MSREKLTKIFKEIPKENRLFTLPRKSVVWTNGMIYVRDDPNLLPCIQGSFEFENMKSDRIYSLGDDKGIIKITGDREKGDYPLEEERSMFKKVPDDGIELVVPNMMEIYMHNGNDYGLVDKKGLSLRETKSLWFFVDTERHDYLRSIGYDGIHIDLNNSTAPPVYFSKRGKIMGILYTSSLAARIDIRFKGIDELKLKS